MHPCFANGPLHYQGDTWQRGQSHNGAEQWQICFLYYEMLCYVLWMLLLLFLLKADNCRLDKIKARVVDLFRNRGTIKVNWIQGKTFVASNTIFQSGSSHESPCRPVLALVYICIQTLHVTRTTRATHTFFKFIYWTVNSPQMSLPRMQKTAITYQPFLSREYWSRPGVEKTKDYIVTHK